MASPWTSPRRYTTWVNRPSLGAHRKNPGPPRAGRVPETGGRRQGAAGCLPHPGKPGPLSREHIQPALLLALNLLQAGIRIVQLKPAEMIFDDKSDTMPVMMMMMELSRGHGESAIKSERCGKAWVEKRNRASGRPRKS